MEPRRVFKFCPQCGAPRTPGEPSCPFTCNTCGLVYFFNPAVAAGAFIQDPEGRTLFIRRARDPARGMLALPGGFIDIAETAEAALAREIREEVDLEITGFRFLCSAPNVYLYREVSYPVLDLYFTARTEQPHAVKALDDVAGCVWRNAADVRAEELAFPSLRIAHAAFLATTA